MCWNSVAATIRSGFKLNAATVFLNIKKYFWNNVYLHKLKLDRLELKK